MACETESSSFINRQYTGNTITEKKDRMRWTEDVLGWDLLKRYDSLPAKPSKYYHHYPAGAVVSCCGLTSALRTIEVAGWLGKYKGTRRSGLGPKEFNNEHEQFIVWHFSQRLVFGGTQTGIECCAFWVAGNIVFFLGQLLPPLSFRIVSSTRLFLFVCGWLEWCRLWFMEGRKKSCGRLFFYRIRFELK